MPELPEVEVLARHLAPRLLGRRIQRVEVRRAKILKPTSIAEFEKCLRGAVFDDLSRRGKYLVFTLHSGRQSFPLLGHLGMTGRMYVDSADAALPRHAAVVLGLNVGRFVFEDTRYFGRLTLDTGPLTQLGPEPLSRDFTVEAFAAALKRSGQAIKIKLLDQRVVAGVGNIYASEALFRAGISPRIPARRLTRTQVARLREAIRETLTEAIAGGSTVPLNYSGAGGSDGLFYFGRAPGAEATYEERLRVYDRAGQACPVCRGVIRRLVQAARSTFYCPRCQRV